MVQQIEIIITKMKEKCGAGMDSTPEKKLRIPVKIIVLLTLLIVGCVVAAGCSIPTLKNTKGGNSSSPAITPSIGATTPVVMQTTVSGGTGNSSAPKKGQLNIVIGSYNAGIRLPVFIDNVSAGNVSQDTPLNLTPDVGRHTVRICVTKTCIQEEVLVISSNPTTVDFEERLKNEVVTGEVRVSAGGYTIELPVFVDDVSVGKISMGKPLNLRASEGPHSVKVCVGVICENETIDIKFGQPVFFDFGERLKKVAEFETPTIRIVDYQQNDNRVTVNVEFINPGNKDLTMTATIRVAYSYINPVSHWKEGSTKQSTVTQSVKAGSSLVKSLDLSLTGGSAYNIEIPAILDSSFE
jgi:hypothetical protein